MKDVEIEIDESKGAFDPEQAYLFELTKLEVREDVILDEKAPKEIRGKAKNDKVVTEWLMKGNSLEGMSLAKVSVDLGWTERNSGRNLTLFDGFLVADGQRITYNPENPSEANRGVLWARALGVGVAKGVKFRVGDIFKPNMFITAKAEEKPHGRFHQINIDTVVLGQAQTAPAANQPIPTTPAAAPLTQIDVPAEVQEQVINALYPADTTKHSKSHAESMSRLTNANPAIVGAYLAMFQNGMVKYA